MTTADRVLGSSGSSLACGLLSVRQKMTPPLWLGCLHKFRHDGETSKPENRIGGCTQLHHKLYKAKNKVKLNLGSPVISWCDSELKVWQTFSEQLNIWIHHSFSLCCVSTNAKISLLLCSKLHVLDFLFGFNQICTYFKQTSVLKIIKVGEQDGWILKSICKVLIRAMFLVVYTAESSFSAKHCCSEPGIHQNTCLTKAASNNRYDRVRWRKSSISTKARSKANVFKFICDYQWCPNLGPRREAGSGDELRETVNTDRVELNELRWHDTPPTSQIEQRL